MSLHDEIVDAVFGPVIDDQTVTNYLVLGGYVFIASHVITTAVLTPANYGRYTESSPWYLNCKAPKNIQYDFATDFQSF